MADNPHGSHGNRAHYRDERDEKAAAFWQSLVIEGRAIREARAQMMQQASQSTTQKTAPGRRAKPRSQQP